MLAPYDVMPLAFGLQTLQVHLRPVTSQELLQQASTSKVHISPHVIAGAPLRRPAARFEVAPAVFPAVLLDGCLQLISNIHFRCKSQAATT